MSNLVIVAIPDENDRVWKVSSEKVPHLTLLFLGDVNNVANVEQIVQFVEHAASQTLRRFWLPVDRRDELGEDKADVLFFKKGRYDYKAIRDFRAVLLKDDNIRTAYDSTEQFEGPWQPHLTLGYPDNPAKPDETDRDYGFYDVQFNKVAVWLDDFDGPEFLLKDYWDEYEALEAVPMDVAMSAIRHDPERDPTAELGAAFLAHYGVKGMKWGVRNDKGGSNTSGVGEKRREGLQRYLDPQGHDLTTDIVKVGAGVLVPIIAPLTWPAQIRLIRGGARGAKAKALDRQEKKFEKNAMSPRNFAAIHNGAIPRMNREVDAINKKYPNPNKDAATRKKYDAEVLKLMQDAYKESANSLTNKAMTRHLDVEFKGDGQDVKIVAKEGPPTPMAERLKHADGEEDFVFVDVEITGKIKRDAVGHILGIELDGFESDSMAQSAVEIGEEFVLEHYGVKGMRWGVRRGGEPSAVAPSAMSRVPHGKRRKTQIKTEGGENHPAHEDAIKVAQARAKLKKSGPAALSNQELREMANRLQLENQVSILTSSKGKQFVSRQFESETKSLAKLGIREGAKAAGPRVLKKARRGAATAGTAAALAL